jgi:hypothetical protein
MGSVDSQDSVDSSGSSRDTASVPGATRDLLLQGARLAVARLVWLVLFGAVLVQVIVLIPHYLPDVGALCPETCLFSQGTAQTYAANGLAPAVLEWGSLALYLLIVVVSCTLAAILFWRRSQEWMVLVVAYFLVAYPISNLGVAATNKDFGTTLPSIVLVELPAVTVFFAVFLIFPSGRFVPRWSWLLLLIWVVAIIASIFWPNSPYVIAYPVCYGGAAVCQIYRYTRESTFIQRQQTKWVVFAFIVSLVANQAFWLLPGSALSLLYRPIFYLVYLLVLLFVPITFYIAIQRHRLYEIDVIINRTLVYGSLTLILAGIYVGGIIGLQSLLSLVTQSHGPTDGQSPLAIVVSTLVIAALFQPLRHRLQQLIDRRFYRQKYDAEKTLAAFAGSLRDEVDLHSLERQLLEIIDDTMQPSSAWIWLRSTAPTPSDRLGPETGHP